MAEPTNTMTLLQLSRLVASLVQRPETQGVWVTAELLDVAVRGGHCYMELLEKDERGVQIAKARGVIWASSFPHIDSKFTRATGQRFASGLKVKLKVSASMHPVYGFSLVVSDVDPDFTMGDLLRRRREILMRLKEEGILELNRTLPFPGVPQRIAVISARGAAGYGDFINQLYSNPSRLRFVTRLYPAVMQGATAPASIIGALDIVAADADRERWDCVVIIRGGGATSDLQAYEDYDLAANVAQFPLPVVIGIGHERDVTVLDWVANKRLKTPTAVAEWLVQNAQNALDAVVTLGNRILQTATSRISGYKEQLAQAEGLLPTAARNAVERRQSRLHSAALTLAGISSGVVKPQLTRLQMLEDSLNVSPFRATKAQGEKLDNLEVRLGILSPQSTLARGYSITRVNGRAVTDPRDIAPGTEIETTLAGGTLISKTI